MRSTTPTATIRRIRAGFVLPTSVSRNDVEKYEALRLLSGKSLSSSR